MNDITDKYYEQYEKLITQILLSERMTFFTKADLLEKMDEDLCEKIEQVKSFDFAC